MYGDEEIRRKFIIKAFTTLIWKSIDTFDTLQPLIGHLGVPILLLNITTLELGSLICHHGSARSTSIFFQTKNVNSTSYGSLILWGLTKD